MLTSATQAVPHVADPPLISLEHISKVFSNGTVALKEMSLDIREHEFISLLGPSGCGKSTVLRIIANLTPATEGRVNWGQAATSSDIGFVFQEPTLMPWATVFDNVWLPLKLKGQSRTSVRDEIEHTLELVGLESFRKSYPRELSGGMKMRVSITRALVTRPKLLLMDEPFAALDEITRNKLNNDLLQLWQDERWTVIFVTHSVFESVYLSNRIVVMAARPGRVIEEIAIDAGYPRDDDFRTSTANAEYCRTVSASLKQAMQVAVDG